MASEPHHVEGLTPEKSLRTMRQTAAWRMSSDLAGRGSLSSLARSRGPGVRIRADMLNVPDS